MWPIAQIAAELLVLYIKHRFSCSLPEFPTAQHLWDWGIGVWIFQLFQWGLWRLKSEKHWWGVLLNDFLWFWFSCVTEIIYIGHLVREREQYSLVIAHVDCCCRKFPSSSCRLLSSVLFLVSNGLFFAFYCIKLHYSSCFVSQGKIKLWHGNFS